MVFQPTSINISKTETYIKVKYLTLLYKMVNEKQKRKAGITIYPPEETIEQLKQEAKNEGRTLSNFILWIINKYHKQNENGRPNQTTGTNSKT